MIKNKLLVLFLLILSIAPPIVSADVITPGTKVISSCEKISNINDYPDYEFIAYPTDMSSGYAIIPQDNCIAFYKFAHPTIYAVKKSNFNEATLKEKNYTEVQNYFKDNPQVIHSGIELSSQPAVPENVPLSKIVTVLKITSLNESNLEIQKSKIIYTYTDGSSEEKVFQTQENTPEPSKKAILPWWFVELSYIILPILAIVGIILILSIRKSKK